MKSFYFKSIAIMSMLLSTLLVSAQKENVGIGTAKPDQSAILDLNSSNKGLLTPRMSLEQRGLIQNPANGLLVYQTDFLSGFYFYDGKEWQKVTSANSVASTLSTNGTSNFIAKFTGASTIDNSSIYEDGVGNVGIGNTSPNAKLNVTGNILASGSIKTSQFAIYENKLEDYASSGTGEIAISYNGLNGGTTQFRNLGIYDGKNGQIAYFNGATKGTQLYGSLNVGSGTINSGNIISSSNISATGTITANVALKTSQFAIYQNKLEDYLSSGTGEIAISYNGLNGGTTQFRNLGIYDGKNGQVAYFNGATKGTQLFGPLTSNNSGYFQNTLKLNTTTGYLAVGDFEGVGLTTPSGYRLIVQDGILTEKIKVALKSSIADWADYVFDSSYKLIPLEKVEEFVKENKHLPNVPSADDMVNSGLDVAKTSAKLMEKIEELTLYIIEMNKEIKALKAENTKFKK